MTLPPFEPVQSVLFDLGRGRIALRDSGERVLVSPDALLALCANAGDEALLDFGRRLGTEAGRRCAERLGEAASVSLEALVEHLGGDLALMGMGTLALERWGQALVFVITDSPFGAAGDRLLAAVVEGALLRAFGRNTGVVRLERNDNRSRFFVTSPQGAERVRSRLASGTGWGDILVQLDLESSGGAS